MRVSSGVVVTLVDVVAEMIRSKAFDVVRAGIIIGGKDGDADLRFVLQTSRCGRPRTRKWNRRAGPRTRRRVSRGRVLSWERRTQRWRCSYQPKIRRKFRRCDLGGGERVDPVAQLTVQCGYLASRVGRAAASISAGDKKSTKLVWRQEYMQGAGENVDANEEGDVVSPYSDTSGWMPSTTLNLRPWTMARLQSAGGTS